MPLYQYKATNEKGQSITGKIEAADEASVIHLIEEKNLILISLQEEKKERNVLSSIPFFNKVNMKELVIFSRQFAVMLKASVPVVQTLRILIKQTSNSKLKMVLTEVANDVDGGLKLSQALSHHPKVFSNFFVAMIKSGETSGRLDDILEYLANQQEKDYDLMSKIKGAMIYPAFIICGLLGVGGVMMVVVIPKLTAILQETGGKLPTSTKMLIGVSNFLSGYWWLLMIVFILGVVGLRYIIKTPGGKKYWDWLIVKLPILGKLFQRIYLVRFTQSLATLSDGGLPLVESLKIVSEVVGNNVYRNIIDQTVKEVEDGNPIASVFLNSKEIPVMVSHMIDVGEQTGRLDVVLEKLTNFYTREIDNLVNNMVSLIEPLIMVVLGVAVGLMVAAIIMPMYNLASSF